MIRDKQGFVRDASELHNGFYNYDKFVYIKSIVKSTIVCPIHGDFLQSANKHLSGRGCPSCGAETRARKKIETSLSGIEQKLNTIHGDKYSYPSFNYTKRKDKIEVVCTIHGAFNTTLDSLLKGSGCSVCGHSSEKVSRNGCSRSVIDKSCKNKDSKAVFYIALMEGQGEIFVKIGVSSNLKTRFSNSTYRPTKIQTFELNEHHPMTLENIVKEGLDTFFPELKYKPKFKFGGYTECYSVDIFKVFSNTDTLNYED